MIRIVVAIGAERRAGIVKYKDLDPPSNYILLSILSRSRDTKLSRALECERFRSRNGRTSRP